jgi:predicted metal-binding membrane protein
LKPDTGDPAAARREFWIVGAALTLLALLAWVFTAHQAMMMMHMDHGAMRQPGWTLRDAGLLLLMWSVMMIAMMTPAIAPMVTAFATINRRRRDRGAAFVRTPIFVAGYLLAWTGFSALASGLQIALHTVDLLDPMMAQTSPLVAAGLLAVAGLYQLSPFKDVCLSRCRSTEGFILSEWRDGPAGAVVMGLRHGLFCIGCCAPLMLLLFAGSVMDLRWVAGLTIVVMIEKLLPRPDISRRLIGGLLLAAAVFVLWQSER